MQARICGGLGWATTQVYPARGTKSNVRATMALGIVEFLEQDKGLIEQEMSASSATAGG